MMTLDTNTHTLCVFICIVLAGAIAAAAAVFFFRQGLLRITHTQLLRYNM